MFSDKIMFNGKHIYPALHPRFVDNRHENSNWV